MSNIITNNNENKFMILSVEAEIVESLRITVKQNNNIDDIVSIKLNDIIELHHIDSENYNKEIIIGKLIDFDTEYIVVDCSEEFKAIMKKISISNIRKVSVLRDGLIQPL